MEYDVIFPNGMEALGGACACRLLRLAPDSTAFILQHAENGSERLLLGDVRRIWPGGIARAYSRGVSRSGLPPR